jgi:hypothetical protein
MLRWPLLVALVGLAVTSSGCFPDVVCYEVVECTPLGVEPPLRCTLEIDGHRVQTFESSAGLEEATC